jgi:uncharacterized protein (DUF58 family)
MIVPRSRLLFWFAAVVLPFALLAAIDSDAVLASGGFIIAFVVIVAIDALGARRSLTGIDVELPPVARLSKDREGRFDVRIHNAPQRRRNLRIALGLPPQIPAVIEELEVILPAGSEWSRLTWICRPVERGNFRLKKAYIEGSSSLGFWAIRKTFPVQCELRVYPNLLTERKNLAALFLNRGTFGLHAQRQVGKGRDFEKLRDYVPGDGFDEIHWKATARRGKPVTKVFQIERTQEVYVVVDASRLSARKSVVSSPWSVTEEASVSSPTTDHGLRTADSVLERFVTAALVLGLAAEQQGDLFGLLTFTNKVETFVRARNGKAHYSACRDALYTLQPQTVTPDFDELCTFLRLRLRRRALIIFLTSLDDPALAESFVRNIDLIRRQHLVLVNMIQPPGTVPLFTDSNVNSTDDLYRQLGGHLQWSRLRQLEKTLQRRGVRFSLLQNERLSADLVSQYLNVKQRQIL